MSSSIREGAGVSVGMVPEHHCASLANPKLLSHGVLIHVVDLGNCILSGSFLMPLLERMLA